MATRKKSATRTSGEARKSASIRTTKPAQPAAALPDPLPAHRIHTLLHTVRCIAQAEDHLCVLLQASKRGNRLSAGVQRELAQLLDRMPSHEYTEELDAVRGLLTVSTSR